MKAARPTRLGNSSELSFVTTWCKYVRPLRLRGVESLSQGTLCHASRVRAHIYSLRFSTAKFKLSALVEGPLLDAFSQGQLHNQTDLHLYVMRTMLLGVIGVIGMKVNRAPFPILGNRAPRWRRAAEARRLRKLKASTHRSYFADISEPFLHRLAPQTRPEVPQEMEQRRNYALPSKGTHEDFH